MSRTILLALSIGATIASLANAQTREERVLADRKKFENDPHWIYNDVARGFAEAKKTGKPMLVVLRCLPCVECVKLDDDLLNEDKRVRALLDKFVCVRVVSTNGLDLSLFQFDYDQSFAAFLLNADGAVYGRFGTRSHRTSWADDVSIDGLANALSGALDLHQKYPGNKAELALKRGPAPDAPAPELLPTLKGRYGPKITYESKVVQSCIHCHQIGDAQKEIQRAKKEPFSEQLLFSYPHPKILGLILDPKECATVQQVEKSSIAEKAGFASGDRIVKLHGQTPLSIADVQWVLHHASPQGDSLKVEVQRNGRGEQLTLDLPKGWRQRDDLSWRSSTWGLRRMATAGMLLVPATPEERKQAGIPDTGMALRVKHLGMFGGPHGAALAAGVRKDDIVISFDGQANFDRETDLIAHSLFMRRPGERVPVTVMRGGKKLDFTLPIQP